MKTSNWRHSGWFARNFIITTDKRTAGHFTFDNSWSLNALYTDAKTQLKFIQKGFWDRHILIAKDEKAKGKIHSGLFGEQTLQLETGEKFTLTTSFWEQEIYWKNDKSKTMIKYKQALLSSMEKGVISSEDLLTIETEKLLISSELFIRQLLHKQRAILITILLLITAAANQ